MVGERGILPIWDAKGAAKAHWQGASHSIPPKGNQIHIKALVYMNEL